MDFILSACRTEMWSNADFIMPSIAIIAIRLTMFMLERKLGLVFWPNDCMLSRFCCEYRKRFWALWNVEFVFGHKINYLANCVMCCSLKGSQSDVGPKHFLSHTSNVSSLSASCLSPKHTVKNAVSVDTTGSTNGNKNNHCLTRTTKPNKQCSSQSLAET